MTDTVPAPSPLEPGQVLPEPMPDDYVPGTLIDDVSMEERLWPEHEAERSYLAALLQRDDANEVLWRSTVEPIHFENPDAATILEAMIAVRDRGERVDFLTVGDQLANVRLETMMWKCTDHYANPGFVEHFADQVMARHRRRSYGVMGSAITEVAGTTAANEMDTAVEEIVEAVMNQPTIADSVHTGETLLNRVLGDRAEEVGIPTPWPRLDRSIKGFRRGQLYVVSGDTGSGKSAIALQMAYALSLAGTCLYFTMEMSEGEMQDRLVAQQAQVPLDFIERQHYPGGIRERIAAFARQPVSIVFNEQQSVSAATVRRTALGTDHLSGIVVDQLALMDLGDHKGLNQPDVIAKTTSALKAMAADLDIPIILVSQLNREAARQGRPTRHHLYGSSSIGNDAGVIMILWREDPEIPMDLSLIVDKNRFGEPGLIRLQWEGEFVRATDPTA